MKNLTTATLVLGLLSGATTVYAADLPVKAPILAPTLFSWTGFYIGGNIGGSWLRTGVDPVDPTIQIQQVSGVNVPGRGVVIVPGTTMPSQGFGTTSNTFVGGGQAGYNAQFGRFVIGVEGDAQAGSGSRSAGSYTILLPFTAITAPSPITISRRVAFDWTASIRLRGGFTVTDRLLVYGTGGLAIADARVSSVDTYSITPGPGAPPFNSDIGPLVGYPSTTGTASDSKTHLGWTLGVGGDWAVTDNVVVGVLYRHSDYGRKTYNSGTNTLGAAFAGGLVAPGLLTGNDSVRITDDQATVRVSYKFGAR